MILRVQNAMREALNQIQSLGFIVTSARDGENIMVFWPREDDPPEIESLLNILQADREALGEVLEGRTVSLPLWLLLGCPWERPVQHWNKMHKAHAHSKSLLNSKKRAYAAACIEFYKNQHDVSWKLIAWDEPWPIAA